MRAWPKDRLDAFLAAERAGAVARAPGGWIVEGKFVEKLPYKGDFLTAYFDYLADDYSSADTADEEQ